MLRRRSGGIGADVRGELLDNCGRRKVEGWSYFDGQDQTEKEGGTGWVRQ